MIGGFFGTPNGPGPDEKCVKDTSGGSGPYKAGFREDPTLPDHTIYAPLTAPPDSVKVPVIVWGNGACMAIGTMFANFLTEIASHGFIVIANGGATAKIGAMSTYRDIIRSVDWVTSNPAVKKYGNIDTSKITAAGQSCGGLEAYDATLNDPRIKMTALFNSGYLVGSSSKAMAKFKHPIAYFLGGPTDMAQKNGETDYKYLPASVPSLLTSIDVGHMGSYYQKYGGKIAKAAVPFFKWQLKGDTSQKAIFCAPASAPALPSLGFKIQSKNGLCA